MSFTLHEKMNSEDAAKNKANQDPREMYDLKALLTLHHRKKILGDLDWKYVFAAANDAADVWRVMCKDVYNLFNKGGAVPESLAGLVAKIKTGDEAVDRQPDEPEKTAEERASPEIQQR